MDLSPTSPPVPAELGDVIVVGSLATNVWRLRGPDGDLVLKAGPGAGDEAEGLRRLTGASVPNRMDPPRVPEVILAKDDLLVTEWVEQGRRAPSAESDLGRALAALHLAPTDGWGGGSAWIGACPVDPSPAPDAITFYSRRLVKLADRCGLTGLVQQLAERLPGIIPLGPPALLHGDLWWGNVLWGTDGGPWLIDPSVHGGHPEEDLAMLALFGDVPDRLTDAYSEVRPLGDGWRERTALWQVYPLLVHTVLFGGSYRSAAEAAIRHYI